MCRTVSIIRKPLLEFHAKEYSMGPPKLKTGSWGTSKNPETCFIGSL